MPRSRGQKLQCHVKGLVKRYTHVQYESFISSGKKVMAKVNVFVHTSNCNTDAYEDGDTRAMTLARRTFFPARKKGMGEK